MPFLPIGDNNPRILIDKPIVTWSIIGFCFGIFFYQIQMDTQSSHSFALGLGLIPAVLTGSAELRSDLAIVPDWLTVVTSMFLHGGFGHLIGNMLFLGIFGDNVEDAMGHGRFIAFYLICGVAAALAHVVIAPAATTPMIGASGAVAGVLGAYLILHPRAWITILLGIFPLVLPAWLLLGGWFLLQFWSALDGGGGVAWWAHVGGFIAGVLLIGRFKRHSLPFSAGRRPPKGVRLKRRRKTGSTSSGPWR